MWRTSCKGREFAWSLTIQNDDAYRFPNFISHDPHRLVQVCVLRKHHGNIEQVAPRVMHQVCRQVHIGAFFFRIPNLDVCRTTRLRVYQGRILALVRKFPKCTVTFGIVPNARKCAC